MPTPDRPHVTPAGTPIRPRLFAATTLLVIYLVLQLAGFVAVLRLWTEWPAA